MHKSPVILIVSILCLTFFNCTVNKNASQPSNLEGDKLTMALDGFSKKTLIPGFSVAVVNEKGVMYAKGFGTANVKTKEPFTNNTIHWVASISKTFIALSIMKLVEQNKLNLDEPINSILPYKIVNPQFADKLITVRHLVTHTSSILDYFDPYYAGESDICLTDSVNVKDFPEYLQSNIAHYKRGKPIGIDENIRKFTQPKAKWYRDSTFIQKEPGTHYQYSNLGSLIAARIVEVKSGMSFIDFTTKYIFKPLKLQNTGWNWEDVNPKLVSKIYAPNTETNPTGVVQHPQSYMTGYPVGGLKTTANDMANYLHEMIKGYSGNGKLLSEASYQTLFAPQVKAITIDSQDAMDKINNMGVHWFLSPDERVWHLGGSNGVYSFIYFNKKTKKGAFAHCNLRDDSFGEILEIVKKFEPKM
jgi:CubicO group peptidase (beta-lactamase class C family)